jgi:hypothetical protein
VIADEIADDVDEERVEREERDVLAVVALRRDVEVVLRVPAPPDVEQHAVRRAEVMALTLSDDDRGEGSDEHERHARRDEDDRDRAREIRIARGDGELDGGHDEERRCGDRRRR